MALPVRNHEQPDLYPETLLDEMVAPEEARGGVDRYWWAIYTRSRQEKSLARDLWSLRIPFYLPLVEKQTCYGKRTVSSRLPVFTNYLFLFGSEDERIASLSTNRVSRILPVPDPDLLRRDLTHLHLLIASGEPLTVESRWQPGQRVRIRRGPLAGLEGTVMERRGRTRLFVAVDFLQRGASMAVDDFLLEPISSESIKKPGTIDLL